MARDRIAEIIGLKSRGNFHIPAQVQFFLAEIEAVWESNEAASDFVIPKQLWAASSIVRTVTCLELFVRGWAARLIDAGPPYAENAAKLTDTKFDFALSRAIEGRLFSIGEIIAHGINTRSIEDVAGVLSTLVGSDIFMTIKDAHDRVLVEMYGKPQTPIIEDLAKVRKDLALLFKARNIIVHELPREPPATPEEARDYLKSALLFVRATEAALNKLLYGDCPLTQADMTQRAWDELDAAEAELDEFLRAHSLENDPAFLAARETFDAHARALAEALHGARGSTAPMLQAVERKRLTDELLARLRARYA